MAVAAPPVSLPPPHHPNTCSIKLIKDQQEKRHVSTLLLLIFLHAWLGKSSQKEGKNLMQPWTWASKAF